MILAIDPGTEQSAYAMVSEPPGPVQIKEFGILGNGDMIRKIQTCGNLTHFVIEMVASYGMAVGQTTFETVFWVGRFYEAARNNSTCKYLERLYRKKDICMHLCHSARAKDANIRQALIDRFGEPGTKSNPGILYGISKDMWSALAIGITYYDRLEPGDWGGN